METRTLKFAAGLPLGLVLFFSQQVLAEGYKDLSDRMIKSAEANSIRKVAVLEFTAKGGAGRADTDYAAENLVLHLAASGSVDLIERALLPGILKETRLASAGGGSGKAGALQSMFELDAVVTGVVFPDGDELRVLARLIDLRTGRVLVAAGAGVRRLPQAVMGGDLAAMEPPEVPFPDFPDPFTARTASAGRVELRDAVAEDAGASCGSRRRLAGKLNALLVDAKARYWAMKMKDPGFDRRQLTKNPGSEISDAGLKQTFYKLLSSYYGSNRAPALDGEKMGAVLDLIKLEKEVRDDCGH